MTIKTRLGGFFVICNTRVLKCNMAHVFICIFTFSALLIVFPPLVGLSEQCRSHHTSTRLKHINRLRHFPINSHTEHSAGGGKCVCSINIPALRRMRGVSLLLLLVLCLWISGLSLPVLSAPSGRSW